MTSSYLLPWVDEQVGLIFHVNEKLNTKEGLMRHVKTLMTYQANMYMYIYSFKYIAYSTYKTIYYK